MSNEKFIKNIMPEPKREDFYTLLYRAANKGSLANHKNDRSVGSTKKKIDQNWNASASKK
jgi:hypothetical protein